MYVFVRITAVILMIIGILVMLGAIFFGVARLVNFYQGPSGPAFPFGGYMNMGVTPGGIIGIAAFIFFQGLIITAAGQLMIIFTDIAHNVADAATRLRMMRVIEPEV